MFVSPTQAVNTFKVSKPTIYRDMNEGILSFNVDGKKHRRIDVAELERLYQPRPSRGNEEALQDVNTGQRDTQVNVQHSVVGNLSTQERIELAVLREQLKTLNIERDRERVMLADQIEQLRTSLDQSLEGQKNLTLMIADQTEAVERLRSEQAPTAKRSLFARLFR